MGGEGRLRAGGVLDQKAIEDLGKVEGGRWKEEGGGRKVEEGGGRWRKVEGGRWREEGGGRWMEEGGRWREACRMWNVECGMWNVECGMWNVECRMWKLAGGRFRENDGKRKVGSANESRARHHAVACAHARVLTLLRSAHLQPGDFGSGRGVSAGERREQLLCKCLVEPGKHRRELHRQCRVVNQGSTEGSCKGNAVW